MFIIFLHLTSFWASFYGSFSMNVPVLLSVYPLCSFHWNLASAPTVIMQLLFWRLPVTPSLLASVCFYWPLSPSWGSLPLKMMKLTTQISSSSVFFNAPFFSCSLAGGFPSLEPQLSAHPPLYSSIVLVPRISVLMALSITSMAPNANLNITLRSLPAHQTVPTACHTKPLLSQTSFFSPPLN